MEAAESLVITKAITCMDKVSTSEGKDDSFELFGQCVALELRTIASPGAQRWAKLQIRYVLNNAQAEHNPHPMEPLPNYPPAPISFSRPQYRLILLCLINNTHPFTLTNDYFSSDIITSYLLVSTHSIRY